MRLEHFTVGELEHLITTAEGAHLVGKQAERTLSALRDILDAEKASIEDGVDPFLAELSHTALSDLQDPLDSLHQLQAQLEEHR